MDADVITIVAVTILIMIVIADVIHLEQITAIQDAVVN